MNTRTWETVVTELVLVSVIMALLAMANAGPVRAEDPNWFWELVRAARAGEVANVYALGQSKAVAETVALATGGSGVSVRPATGQVLAWGDAFAQTAKPTGSVPVPYTLPNYEPGYAAYTGMSWWACGMVPSLAGAVMPSNVVNYAANWQLYKWLAQLQPRVN